MKEETKEQTIASLTQSRSPFDSESGNCDLYINISEYSKCAIWSVYAIVDSTLLFQFIQSANECKRPM